MFLPQEQIDFIKQVCASENLNVSIVIKPPRKTKLGDHTWTPSTRTSVITLNEDENKQRLFFVALHELAHAYVAHHYNRNLFRRKVRPHGTEWKKAFQQILEQALENNLFHENLRDVITQHSKSPKANTHSDIALLEAFTQFDKAPHSQITQLKDLNDGDRFRLKQASSTFTRIKLRRTRYLCKDENGRSFAISPMAEVSPL